MGGFNLGSIFQGPPKQKTVYNHNKDRSLNGKQRVKARKREQREARQRPVEVNENTQSETYAETASQDIP